MLERYTEFKPLPTSFMHTLCHLMMAVSIKQFWISHHHANTGSMLKIEASNFLMTTLLMMTHLCSHNRNRIQLYIHTTYIVVNILGLYYFIIYCHIPPLQNACTHIRTYINKFKEVNFSAFWLLNKYEMWNWQVLIFVSFDKMNSIEFTACTSITIQVGHTPLLHNFRLMLTHKGNMNTDLKTSVNTK